jgi:hypothetical protein
MKKTYPIFFAILVLSLFSISALANSYKLQYKIAPEQIWIATTSSQSESTFMGNKNVNQSKGTIKYKVSSGPKKGWVTLAATIKSQSGSSDGKTSKQMDLSKIKYSAEMHKSGEFRNIQYSGSALPPMETDKGELPPGMAAMYEQSSKMIAEAWKNAVFWFPELPEDALELGDEFEVTKKIGMGNEGMGMTIESVSKQVFTLEEVTDGLAYFSVKERILTKSTAVMGSKSDTKTAGKGEAVFDLKEGMWTDMTIKSRSNLNFGNIPGISENSQELYQISKFRMEKQ